MHIHKPLSSLRYYLQQLLHRMVKKSSIYKMITALDDSDTLLICIQY